jgi:flagellar biosynthesis/type III secretory pathway M-ring protein FliF/YscJ
VYVDLPKVYRDLRKRYSEHTNKTPQPCRLSAIGLRESGKHSRLGEKEATMGVLIPIVAILAIFIGAPAIVFSFIWNTKKSSNEMKKLQYEKEIMELELKKEELQIKRLEEENKKYDHLLKG